jgi:hypothetical protein
MLQPRVWWSVSARRVLVLGGRVIVIDGPLNQRREVVHAQVTRRCRHDYWIRCLVTNNQVECRWLLLFRYCWTPVGLSLGNYSARPSMNQ